MFPGISISGAPVDVVWQMWTQPEHFAAWYDRTAPRSPAQRDVRVCGVRRVCKEMNPPNGMMRIWSTGEHLEVVEG